MALHPDQRLRPSLWGGVLTALVAALASASAAPGQDRFPDEGRRLLYEARSLAEMSGGTQQQDRIAILLAAAHRLDNGNIETLQTLINLSEARQDTASLKIYLQRYLALVPEDEVAQDWLRRLLYLEANTDSARRRLLTESAQNVDLPNATRASAYAMLASRTLRGGAMLLAQQWIAKAYDLCPDDLVLWQTVLEAARMTRSIRPDGPAAAFAQVLQRYPTHVQLAWQFGNSLYSLGLYDEANRLCDYCRQVNPTLAGGRDLAEPFLLQIAGARYAAARYDDAVAVCRDALKVNPNSLGAYEQILQNLRRKADGLNSDPVAQNKVLAEADAAFAEAVRICETLAPNPDAVDKPGTLTQVAAFYLFYREPPTVAEREAASKPDAPSLLREPRRDPATWDKLVARAAALIERARKLAPTDAATARIWAWAKLLGGTGTTDALVQQILNSLIAQQRDQVAALGLALQTQARADAAASDPNVHAELVKQTNQILKLAYNLNRGSPAGYRALKALQAAGETPDPPPSPGLAATYAEVFLNSPAATFYKDKSKALRAVFQLDMEEKTECPFGVPLEGSCMLTSDIPLPPPPAGPATGPATAPAEQTPTDDPLARFPLAPSAQTPLPVTLGPQGLIMPRVVLTVQILEKPGRTIRRVTEADLFRRFSLSPQQSITQRVRWDVGPLDSILMQLPQATLTLRVYPLVGTAGREDDPTKPGPEGFAAAAVTVKRVGFVVNEDSTKKMMANLSGGTIEQKISAATLASALYYEAMFPTSVRYEGYAPKPVDSDALLRGVVAAMGDANWQVRAAAARLAAWLGQEPRVLAALKTAARDPVWVVRLCAIDMLATKVGKQAELLTNSAAVGDSDAMVRQMAFYHSRRLLEYAPK